MRSKKMISALFFAFTFALMMPAFAATENVNPATETPKEILAQKINNRLMEIKTMDKSELTRAEKKELKKEVKELRAEARSNGIYLSVGAIIIIVLLLILLL